MQTCSLGCTLAIGSGDTTCAHVWKLGEFRGTSAHFQTHFQGPSEAVTLCLFYALLRLSHDLQYTFLNVLMHADLFSGMYTCHWIRWYTSAHVWKLGEFRGTSAHFQTHFQSPSETVTMPLLCSFAPLTRPAVHLRKCSNACRPVQWDVHLPLDQVIYLCACVEVGRISWYICALSDAFSEPKWSSAQCLFYALLRLSHDLSTLF